MRADSNTEKSFEGRRLQAIAYGGVNAEKYHLLTSVKKLCAAHHSKNRIYLHSLGTEKWKLKDAGVTLEANKGDLWSA